jgi:hypothetical protein
MGDCHGFPTGSLAMTIALTVIVTMAKLIPNLKALLKLYGEDGYFEALPSLEGVIFNQGKA